MDTGFRLLVVIVISVVVSLAPIIAAFPPKALVTKQSCQEMALQQGDEIIAAIKAGAIHVVPRGGAVS